jgi:hypothetical protein
MQPTKCATDAKARLAPMTQMCKTDDVEAHERLRIQPALLRTFQVRSDPDRVTAPGQAPGQAPGRLRTSQLGLRLSQKDNQPDAELAASLIQDISELVRINPEPHST